MTKKAIVFITAVIIILVALFFITGQFPPPSAEETGGTIGKVQKYRKVQMTEKDVILRSEVIDDTSRLSKSINGLVLFNAFIKDYAADLKSIASKMKQCKYSEKDAQTVADYSSYIEGNRKSVENVIALLTDFYTNDTTNYSVDIEQKLIDFDNFVGQISQKDSLVMRVIKSTEQIVKTNKTKKDQELKKLCDIHDQLIVKAFQYALTLGSSEQIKAASHLELYYAVNLGYVAGSAPFGSAQLSSQIQGNSVASSIINVSALNFVDPVEAIELANVLSKQVLACGNRSELNVILDKQLGISVLQQFGVIVASNASSIGLVCLNTKNMIELENTISSTLSQSVMLKVVNSSVLEGAFL